MINLAVIGTSFITRAFLGACEKTGEYKLTAVYSRTEQKGREFANDFGCDKVYTNLDDLAKDSHIDAVYIASPNSLHFSQSVMMLKAKKHVICEKPLVTKLCDLKEIYKTAQDNGVYFMEAIIPEHLPQLTPLKKAVENLGKITSATLNFKQYSSRYDDFKNGIIYPVFDPKFQGGALNDLGIYNVYVAHLLFGSPERVTSTATLLSNGVDGEGESELWYNDFKVKLTYSKITGDNPVSEIKGENGTITMDSVSKIANVYVNGEFLCGEMEKCELMSYEAQAFSDILKGDKEKYILTKQLSLEVYETLEKLIKERKI